MPAKTTDPSSLPALHILARQGYTEYVNVLLTEAVKQSDLTVPPIPVFDPNVN